MQLTYRTPLWLYPEPVDFRKQIDGLVTLISDQLSLGRKRRRNHILALI